MSEFRNHGCGLRLSRACLAHMYTPCGMCFAYPTSRSLVLLTDMEDKEGLDKQI
jgi:hypothetical protein